MPLALVTGLTGFIGGHLGRALVQERWAVKHVERCSPFLAFTKAETADAVIHLATNYGRDNDPAGRMVEDNVQFPLRLLEESIAREVPLFVNIDTSFTVDYPYQRPYTVSKKQFAQWGDVCCKNTRTKFVNLMLHIVYGPGDNAKKFVPSIIQQCLAGGEIKLTPGEQKKDFTYVGDVVKAIQCLLRSVDDTWAHFTTVDCGTGEAVSVREVVSLIHRITLSTATLNFGALPYRDNELMFLQADNRVLNSLGWCVGIPLEDRLRALCGLGCSALELG
jgi:nucleoside-diphosphate-sugar epimerase